MRKVLQVTDEAAVGIFSEPHAAGQAGDSPGGFHDALTPGLGTVGWMNRVCCALDLTEQSFTGIDTPINNGHVHQLGICCIAIHLMPKHRQVQAVPRVQYRYKGKIQTPVCAAWDYALGSYPPAARACVKTG